jgi:hypothetical protein
LHPELEQLIRKQCERLGESVFLRNLRQGLGSATQRVRLGSSVAEGARQIKTDLLSPEGDQAGSVRFVLAPDGWRIYSIEVWTNSTGGPIRPVRREQMPVKREPVPVQTVQRTQLSSPAAQKRRKSKLPRMFSKKWLTTMYGSGD